MSTYQLVKQQFVDQEHRIARMIYNPSYNVVHSKQLLEDVEIDYTRGIKKAQKQVKREHKKILAQTFSREEISERQKMLRINCLKRGDYESAKGRRILVIVDGTEGSLRAMKTALEKATKRDHLFVVMAYNTGYFDFKPKEQRIILNYEIWTAASEIIKNYEPMLKEAKMRYSLVFVGSRYPRYVYVKLARQWLVDCTIIGISSRSGDKNKGFAFQRPLTLRGLFKKSLPSYFASNYRCELLVV